MARDAVPDPRRERAGLPVQGRFHPVSFPCPCPGTTYSCYRPPERLRVPRQQFAQARTGPGASTSACVRWTSCEALTAEGQDARVLGTQARRPFGSGYTGKTSTITNETVGLVRGTETAGAWTERGLAAVRASARSSPQKQGERSRGPWGGRARREREKDARRDEASCGDLVPWTRSDSGG